MRNYKSRIARLEGKYRPAEERIVIVLRGVRPGTLDQEPNHFQYRDIHSREGESQDEFIARISDTVDDPVIRIFASDSPRLGPPE